ncbi:hypothetical protein R3P38DRAFT_2790300 [Favolaschia claudopus]|uniref:Uncharacterized protein n=1 Tax=Favolaschia claudopus TaxID=2862362 RepID=A0AAW0AHV9_9AGAR
MTGLMTRFHMEGEAWRETRQRKRGAREKAGSTANSRCNRKCGERRRFKGSRLSKLANFVMSRNYRKRSWPIFHRKAKGRLSKMGSYEMMRCPESVKATHGGDRSEEMRGPAAKERKSHRGANLRTGMEEENVQDAEDCVK